MKEIARQLGSVMENAAPQLSQMNAEDVSFKPDPDEWSKKEILGHLIDSAANNHQRFVRAVYNVADQFPVYDQVKWVSIQQHNQRPWDSLVGLWLAYNTHLIHLIEQIPEDARLSPCNIGKEEPVALEFVVKDYLQHLRHHLKDILSKKAKIQ